MNWGLINTPLIIVNLCLPSIYALVKRGWTKGFYALFSRGSFSAPPTSIRPAPNDSSNYLNTDNHRSTNVHDHPSESTEELYPVKSQRGVGSSGTKSPSYNMGSLDLDGSEAQVLGLDAKKSKGEV